MRLALYVGALVLGGLAAWVSIERPYSAGSDLGYYLGLVGGCMMLSLLFYPLRKYWGRMRDVGTLRAWFLVHITFGILGPVLIMFHSLFQLRSFNASVAFWSMIVVTVSGIVGRFLYIHVYQGLGGRHLTLDELEKYLEPSGDDSFRALDLAPHIWDELEQYRLQAFARDSSALNQFRRFVAVSWRRQRLAERAEVELRRILRLHGKHQGWSETKYQREVETVEEQIGNYLRAVDITARLAFWERLLAGWAIAHIPVVYILALSSIAHVVAVHIY
ncbi:MAG: hypothetical protein MUP61_03905 [Burkholderiales bacterium]|nr:hypothetical protein [Burkholderiales bacterium]MCJ7838348.1 hypothetical protein [Burkholderiales bacterium]